MSTFTHVLSIIGGVTLLFVSYVVWELTRTTVFYRRIEEWLITPILPFVVNNLDISRAISTRDAMVKRMNRIGLTMPEKFLLYLVNRKINKATGKQ